MDTTDSQTTRPPESSDERPKSLKGRLGWFILLWVGSVLALYIVSRLIRWAIMP